MSTAKFEKLIDLLINEDQERAEQLFHEIVVEKSREIYEGLMDEDMSTGLMDEVSMEEEGMDGMMEADDEFMDAEIEDDDIDVDGDEDEMDVDAEFSDGEDGDEFGGDDMDMDGEGVTKDDIMNLEDKLDQLMAEFEAEFGDAEEDMDDAEADMDDAKGDMDDMEDEEDGESMVAEAVQLKQVGGATYDKFGKMGDAGSQTKSPVVANSGAKGPVGNVVKPVKFSGDTESVPTSAKGPSNAYSKGEKMTGAKYQNSPGGATGTKAGKGEAAPKPKHGDDGSNKKSPVAESRRTAKKRI